MQMVNRKYLQGGLRAVIFLRRHSLGGGGNLVGHHAPPAVGSRDIGRLMSQLMRCGEGAAGLTGPASWWWPSPASPGSAAAARRRHRGPPSPARGPGRSRCPAAARPAGTAGRDGLAFSLTLVLTLMLTPLTCLWRWSLSSSDSTQPTLPSPPHTRIRKVTNFWKSRSLVEREGAGAISLLAH